MKNKFIIYYFFIKCRIFKYRNKYYRDKISTINMVNLLTNKDDSYKLSYETIMTIYASYFINYAILNNGIKNINEKEIYNEWQYDRERMIVHKSSKWLISVFMELTIRNGFNSFIKNKKVIDSYKKLYNGG